jgi:hypothetical protein
MYNIKIKSVPNKAKTGSQLDYSLVDRNTLFLKPDTQVQSDVKNTISEVPRDQANIEAEGGETIIGDTNNDGFLEHQTIVGKRHSKGGVPLNVPEGSFIFSDTDKLRIKDPEILKMFGMAPNKKGYTPAEIAKKYQVNDYMAILKDDTKDKYSKETAQVMLDSNLKKLGMLALVQESMKGFPDGVPAIAESVMEGVMGGSPEQEEEQTMPQARYGGTQLPKAQFGIPLFGAPIPVRPTNGEPAKDEKEVVVNDTINTVPIPLEEVAITNKRLSAIPKIGDVYYVDGQPIKISDIEESTTGDWLPNWLNDPSGVYFSPLGTTDYGSKNKKYYLTFEEFKKLRDRKDPNTVPVLTKQGRTASSWWTADDNRAYKFSARPTAQPTREYGKYKFDQNDILELPTGKYKVVDTQYGVGEKNPLLAPERFLGLPADLYNEKIRAKNLTTGQIEDLRLDELEAKIKAGFAKNLTKNPEAAVINPDGTPATGEMNITGKDSTTTNSSGVEEQTKDKEVGKPALTPAVKKLKVTQQTNVNDVPTTTTSEVFKFGGLTQYQTAGAVNNTGKKVVSKVVSSVTGNTKVTYSDGSTEIIPANVSYDVEDAELRKNVGEKGYNFIELDPQFRYQNKVVGPQGKTTGYVVDPESGFYYHPDPKVGAPKPGAAGLANYMKIHKEAIDAYPGGAEAWKKTMIEAGGKENPAMNHLLEFENKVIGPIANGKEYIDLNKKGARIPGVENFNLPGISKAQVAQRTPVTQRNIDVDVDQKNITPSVTSRTRGWFTPDMLNLANAFGKRMGNFPPTLEQVNFQTGPYNLLSPEGEIAKIQSTGNMLSNQAANTMAGNVGFNAALGAQGQILDRVTDTQGKYSNADVGISNEASRFGAGVFNQGQLSNAELMSAFDRDRAIYGQQRVNALNAKDNAMTRAYNQAWGNAFKANMLEDMFPQVGIDRVFGDIGYSGVGRDYHTYDTYINPLTAAASSKGGRTNQDFDWDDDDWKEMSAFTNKGIENGLSKDQAYTLASKMVMAKKSRNNAYDPYNSAQSVYAGLGSMGWDNTDRDRQ